MKGNSTLPQAQTLLEPHHQIDIISRRLAGMVLPSVEMQSMNSTASPTDWSVIRERVRKYSAISMTR